MISLKLLLMLLIVVSCAAGITLASIYFHTKFDQIEGTVSIEDDHIMVSFDVPLSQLRKRKTIRLEISDHMTFPGS